MMLKRPRRTAISAAVWAVLIIAVCSSSCNSPEAQPVTHQATPLSFAVFGDNRPKAATAPQPEVFHRICADIGALAPDFVIGVGDYILGANDEAPLRAQWADFFRAMQPIQSRRRVPFAPTTGNHDIRGSRLAQGIFKEYFKRLYFSFDRGGCHFVILDSETPGQAGRIAGSQWEWLQADLRQHQDAALTFVALHRPLFPVDGHVGSSMDVDVERRDALHRLFVDEGVDVVFARHEHLFNDQTKHGVRYVITGGAGASLYASEDKGGFHHFLVVRVWQGQYTLDVRRPSSG